MGHALDNTLQDILIRWRRMKGDDVLWQPGTDHAGIATQMVVVRNLEQEGIGLAVEGADKGPTATRSCSIARSSSPRSGSGRPIPAAPSPASCAGSAPRATGAASASPWTTGSARPCSRCSSNSTAQGLIYKDNRLVNWDPKMLTAISDLEVESREVKGNLWFFKYPIEGSDEHIVVATTRPETMLGDTAVAVHPDDPKWKHLIGKHAILPLVGRRIPIVGDEYSDPGEGLGRGQDHAGARLQRLRGRQAAQARGDLDLRQVRTAQRQRAREVSRPRPLRGAQAHRRRHGGARACSRRSSRTPMRCPMATAAACRSSRS